MEFTDDELTCLVEALREYSYRVPVHGGRRVVCNALVYRIEHKLLVNHRRAYMERPNGTRNEQ
jgi:hypothetical protein